MRGDDLVQLVVQGIWELRGEPVVARAAADVRANHAAVQELVEVIDHGCGRDARSADEIRGHGSRMIGQIVDQRDAPGLSKDGGRSAKVLVASGHLQTFAHARPCECAPFCAGFERLEHPIPHGCFKGCSGVLAIDLVLFPGVP